MTPEIQKVVEFFVHGEHPRRSLASWIQFRARSEALAKNEAAYRAEMSENKTLWSNRSTARDWFLYVPAVQKEAGK